MDDTQTLFCTPCSLWNCIEWSNKDVKTVLSNTTSFLSKNIQAIFKSVDKAAIANRSAIFNRLRNEIAEADKFDAILQTANAVPAEDI